MIDQQVGRNSKGQSIKIGRNAWDAWKGYVSGRWKETFGASSEETQEQAAKRWFQEQVQS